MLLFPPFTCNRHVTHPYELALLSAEQLYTDRKSQKTFLIYVTYVNYLDLFQRPRFIL